MNDLRAFASCLPGLEPLVARELRSLGIEARDEPGGVAFVANAAVLMRCGLWLGSASHLLVRIAEFPCRALGELERKSRLLPWRDWLRPDVAVAVRATAKGSRVYHTSAIAERIENAIRAVLDTPPAGNDEDGIAAQLTVRFRNDVCTISLDTGSTPLHRRGYRLASAKAPLREDIAHALVLASGFEPGYALLDPFCGSGTIAIEAAALARGLPPGRLRPPPLSHLAPFDGAAWEQAQSFAHPPTWPARVAAADRDAGAVGMARANAERAGVADAIEFECGAFGAHAWFAGDTTPERGVVVTNPPFGRRVAQGSGLLHLYQNLGHRIRGLGNDWRTALLAHDVRLARRTGLDLTAAFTTKHGGLDVTALVTAKVP